MDQSDLASGSNSDSNSDSDKENELMSDDPLNEFEDESMDDFEDDDEEMMGANVVSFSPASMEKTILKIHQEYKDKALKFLKDFQGKLTLSYEWLILANELTRGYNRGPILHHDFQCVTAHFIDDNWKIKKWILRYTPHDNKVPLDDVLVFPFRSAVEEYVIGNKVSTLLLPNDGDFNDESMAPFRKLIEERADNPVNPPVFLLYCCADLFRMMVNDVYETFGFSLLEDLRMLVGWGRLSSTNWNVTLFHLQQAVDLKAEDAFSKDEIYNGYDKPSDEEWIKIQTYCTLTGCIYKVAKELFEEGYSTSNVYFHLLAELKLMLNQESANAGGNEYFLRKAQKLLKRFNKYWGNMFLVLATASVLDPRFKTKYLEFYCSKKEVNDEGSKAETVLEYLRTLYARYAASDILSKPICPDGTIESEEVEDDDDDDDEEEDYCDDEEIEAEKEKEKNKPDAYKDFVLFQEYLKFEGSSIEFQESELNAYLKEPVMEWNKDFKVLEFWKEESQNYPILSRIARDILSIPISRATSYDAYVVDRREPSESVLSAGAKAANAMMCGRSWLQK